MKNKKVLGILIGFIGAIISVACFIYTSSLNILLPTMYLTRYEILKMQFDESHLLIPFILGIILIMVGLIIFIKETLKKKK